MAIIAIGIDLAKNVFAVHGVDASGKAVLVRPAVRRDALLELIAKLPPCLIGMEACATGHYWARELTKLHEEVRRGDLAALARAYEEGAETRGEIVIVVAPPSEETARTSEADVEGMLRRALKRVSVKDAVSEIAAATGRPRRPGGRWPDPDRARRAGTRRALAGRAHVRDDRDRVGRDRALAGAVRADQHRRAAPQIARRALDEMAGRQQFGPFFA